MLDFFANLMSRFFDFCLFIYYYLMNYVSNPVVITKLDYYIYLVILNIEDWFEFSTGINIIVLVISLKIIKLTLWIALFVFIKTLKSLDFTEKLFILFRVPRDLIDEVQKSYENFHNFLQKDWQIRLYLVFLLIIQSYVVLHCISLFNSYIILLGYI
jgi:hypothetical protein